MHHLKTLTRRLSSKLATPGEDALLQVLQDYQAGPLASLPATACSMEVCWSRNIINPIRPISPVNLGAIDALGSQKTARFANLCDHFGSVGNVHYPAFDSFPSHLRRIPILNLVDLPGFAIGTL